METAEDSAFYCQLLLHEDRLRILGALAAKFEPGVTYPEPAVNDLLRRHHDDYAALRRYLVDAGLLRREQGMYWRAEEAMPEAGRQGDR